MDSILNHLNFDEWLKLLIRWAHVFAGIMWVGTTYFFTWLDGRFGELAEKSGSDVKSCAPEKNVWMVHSGGFYRVEKQKVPSVMPNKLHWFRWEAAITWLTGVLLLVIVYYQGGLMVSLEDSPISQSAAIWLSAGLLLASWPVYNLLWFKLVKSDTAGVVFSGLLVLALAWFVSRYLTGRAAYMQVGAMFGTIMAFNVWMRIIPAQRRMVAALGAGQETNQTEAFRAKSCSKHNTFLAVPVVFLMLSNHFPSITYGQRYAWVILSVLIFIGWAAAKWIRRAG
jgi:uncharacterized membrane protein